VSEGLAHTTGVIGVRQNRVVLTPGVCASSVAVMWVARPGTRISHPQGDGGNSASLPGRAHISRKATAQGRPDVLASPVCCCAILLRQSRTVDRGCQPAPGLPCALFQSRVRRPSKARANKPRGCEGASAIRNANGSATLPPTDSSLRAQRTNPESFRVGSPDCFAALAMTRMMGVYAAEIAKLLADFGEGDSRTA
jgi:hypothetical protein